MKTAVAVYRDIENKSWEPPFIFMEFKDKSEGKRWLYRYIKARALSKESSDKDFILLEERIIKIDVRPKKSSYYFRKDAARVCLPNGDIVAIIPKKVAIEREFERTGYIPE